MSLDLDETRDRDILKDGIEVEDWREKNKKGEELKGKIKEELKLECFEIETVWFSWRLVFLGCIQNILLDVFGKDGWRVRLKIGLPGNF